ncbi:MAG: hypothetical protein ACK559_39925, partial [bacterium]
MVARRIEEPSVLGHRAAAWAAVQLEHRQAVGAPRLLVEHAVPVSGLQPSGAKWFDGWVAVD